MIAWLQHLHIRVLSTTCAEIIDRILKKWAFGCCTLRLGSFAVPISVCVLWFWFVLWLTIDSNYAPDCLLQVTVGDIFYAWSLSDQRLHSLEFLHAFASEHTENVVSRTFFHHQSLRYRYHLPPWSEIPKIYLITTHICWLHVWSLFPTSLLSEHWFSQVSSH